MQECIDNIVENTIIVYILFLEYIHECSAKEGEWLARRWYVGPEIEPSRWLNLNIRSPMLIKSDRYELDFKPVSRQR